MKEIIYIQAGSLANHVGTHFWNTQESYFTYGEEDPIVSHDISFREGLTNKSEPILCPRLLIFDHKSNFGTLSQNRALFDLAGESEEIHENSSWAGDVVEYRQDPIPKSTYQNFMEDEIDESDKTDSIALSDSDVRFWSDFNRVYYIPRTVQRLPDAAEWENIEGDWTSGQELFQRYNEESVLMDESLRLFVEECDSIQGIQVMNDTATFGAFTDAFLTSFRDEFAKLSSVVFPFLSSSIPGHIDVDDPQGIRKAVNDALYLRNLNELSSLSVPIQSPSTWTPGEWETGLDVNKKITYHTSALLSTHIEGSTLPLRLKGVNEDLASLCAQLNWRGTTRFSRLSGIFPFESSSAEEIDKKLFDFSTLSSELYDRTIPSIAERDVLRGFDQHDVLIYDTWRGRSSIREPFITSTYTLACPLPTSFPAVVKSPPYTTALSNKGTQTPSRTAALKVLSSLSTRIETLKLFSTYASFVEECVRRRTNPGIGLDSDELKDLSNDLWAVVDGFGDGDTGGTDPEDELGEDEE